MLEGQLAGEGHCLYARDSAELLDQSSLQRDALLRVSGDRPGHADGESQHPIGVETWGYADESPDVSDEDCTDREQRKGERDLGDDEGSRRTAAAASSRGPDPFAEDIRRRRPRRLTQRRDAGQHARHQRRPQREDEHRPVDGDFVGPRQVVGGERHDGRRQREGQKDAANHFVVRSSQPAASLVADMRRVVRTIDPELPIFDVVTMREAIQRTMTLERAASFLTAFFAGTALLMAMFGIYGMVSYSIRQRTVEIGLRMALGATSWGVLSLVVGEGLRLAAYGVLVGSLAAIGAASYLDRVFQIGEIGSVPFLCSAALVAVGAFAASFFPAWRAALLSPLVAIRN